MIELLKFCIIIRAQKYFESPHSHSRVVEEAMTLLSPSTTSTTYLAFVLQGSKIFAFLLLLPSNSLKIRFLLLQLLHYISISIISTLCLICCIWKILHLSIFFRNGVFFCLGFFIGSVSFLFELSLIHDN
jgi:hypothetical protein